MRSEERKRTRRRRIPPVAPSRSQKKNDVIRKDRRDKNAKRNLRNVSETETAVRFERAR